MSFEWGIQYVLGAFLYLHSPAILFGTLIGAAVVFVASGFIARFVTFRAIPTLIVLAFATVIVAFAGFATTEFTFVGCSPI